MVGPCVVAARRHGNQSLRRVETRVVGDGGRAEQRADGVVVMIGGRARLRGGLVGNAGWAMDWVWFCEFGIGDVDFWAARVCLNDYGLVACR
ncbi:hypothetical protein M0R45_016584 [Rubus argutus]|uniref:Uncharacterized protein n=1 Tax=Rubus argutus TaxID=59490 RepID=A0AAW1XTT0_RUBAR